MPQRGKQESFFPSGAVAAFLAMIAFYAVFWCALYLLMVHRG